MQVAAESAAVHYKIAVKVYPAVNLKSLCSGKKPAQIDLRTIFGPGGFYLDLRRRGCNIKQSGFAAEIQSQIRHKFVLMPPCKAEAGRGLPNAPVYAAKIHIFVSYPGN